MSEADAMQAGVEKLRLQEQSLDEQRLELKQEENAAMTRLREVGAKVRAARAARVELERRIRELENPVAPVTPEVETLINSVVATAQSAHGPPAVEV